MVIRPISVFAATIGSTLSLKDKLFLGAVYPRGIVAAAVSSLFALHLAEMGYEGANRLAAHTFAVIVGTVVVYSISAQWVARKLGLAQLSPQGVVIGGAAEFARSLALELKERGFRVILVDTNWTRVRDARLAGLHAFHGDIISEAIIDEIDLDGIGRLLALTPNDEANSLAALHFAEVFGRSNVYQLPLAKQPQQGQKRSLALHLQGRMLFGDAVNYWHLFEQVAAGATISSTSLTDKFTFAHYREYHQSALPLCIITPDGSLEFITAKNSLKPKPGDTVISLISGEGQGDSAS